MMAIAIRRLRQSPRAAARHAESRASWSLRCATRAQLEKEGFPAEGDPDFLQCKGTPDIFLISQKTGHGTSPLVRQRLDAFLKEWGDKGQISPDHIRFVTYTTRYNRDYWVSAWMGWRSITSAPTWMR